MHTEQRINPETCAQENNFAIMSGGRKVPPGTSTMADCAWFADPAVLLSVILRSMTKAPLSRKSGWSKWKAMAAVDPPARETGEIEVG